MLRFVRDEYATSLFESAFDSAAIGMALVSPVGAFLDVNEALCKIVGYRKAELLAMNFQSITHPDDLSADLGFVTMMLAGEIPNYHMQKRYFHKDGRVVHILLSVSLVWSAPTIPKFFISQIQDITERVNAETALRQAKQDLERALAEVKELRGFLLICSYCKSIGIEVNDWRTLEQYLSIHHAQLSHGICPKCLPMVKAQFQSDLGALPKPE
jgi:PAS domain S-box-containing protein